MKSFRGMVDCDSKNLQTPFHCVNRFLSKKLNCEFPWSNSAKDVTKNCNKAEDFDKFYDLYKTILQQEMNKELEEFGCGLQNCIRNSWVAETALTVNQLALQTQPFFEHYLVENTTTFWFTIPSNEVKK